MNRKDIRKAALGYCRWKDEQSHFRKPWRYPEDITLPRILITDCLEEMTIDSRVNSRAIEIKSKKENKTISLPSTPTSASAQYKSISNVFPTTNLDNGCNENGNSLPASATGSPLTQKKSKRKFKFKFEKKATD